VTIHEVYRKGKIQQFMSWINTYWGDKLMRKRTACDGTVMLHVQGRLYVTCGLPDRATKIHVTITITNLRSQKLFHFLFNWLLQSLSGLGLP
jgi:hypothetical protein